MLNNKNIVATPEAVCFLVRTFLRKEGTIQDAANKLGVSPQAVSAQLAYNVKENKYFTKRSAIKYAKAFGFSIDYLTKGIGKPFIKSNETDKQKHSPLPNRFVDKQIIEKTVIDTLRQLGFSFEEKKISQKRTDNNYVIIYKWMVLPGLSLSEIIIYAIIYGFTKTGTEFHGGRRYLASYTNLSLPTIDKILRSLEERGLIVRCAPFFQNGNPYSSWKAIE